MNKLHKIFACSALAIVTLLAALPSNASPKKIRKQKPLCINRADLPQRKLKFPSAGWAIGHLYLFRLFRNKKMLFLGKAIQDLGPAKGTVSIPRGKCLGLHLTPESLNRLDELYSLEPNDIQILLVQCMPFSTEDLIKILHLKGLEKLQLDWTQIDNDAPNQIAKLSNLWSITINSSQLTDENLEEFNKLKHLGVLNLDYNRITDTGIAAISKNRTIYSLSINNCKITDKCADYLVNLNQLQQLRIVNSKFNDPALLKLTKMKNLIWIEVGKNQVSKKCLQEVRKAMPGCLIIEVPLDPYRNP